MYRTEPFNIFAQTHAKIHARFFKVKVSGQFEEAYRGHHLDAIMMEPYFFKSFVLLQTLSLPTLMSARNWE